MRMHVASRVHRVLLAILLVGVAWASATNAIADTPKVPVIYCTDLFHPHDDPDDHFDLACLFAMPEVDIKAIVLDQGAEQERRPGRIPVGQLNELTGRKVPSAIGLSKKLRDPLDKGLDEPERYQQGVRLILDTLKKAPRPATIIAVGSLRDVAAAYNREPNLFQKKVRAIYAFIGVANGQGTEYNVGLDPAAYSRIMDAGPRLYWVPCFDGGIGQNAGNASFWRAKHADLLADASGPVMNFFVFALLRKNDARPVALRLMKTSKDERATVLAGERNLWSGAVFPYAAGRKYVERDGRCLGVPADQVRPGDKTVDPFRFVPVEVSVDAQGREWLDGRPGSQTVQRFQIVDRQGYAQAMTSVTRQLIGDLYHDGRR